MNVAALIIGIDGWEEYTLPLVKGILRHEPTTKIVVIDNASEEPYKTANHNNVFEIRTERLCYSAAINKAKRCADTLGEIDWYVVLSNDVMCVGEFHSRLERAGDLAMVGPTVGYVWGQYPHIMGYCVAIPHKVWDSVGNWDENFTMSSWEDVDYSIRAYRMGFKLCYDENLPFVHLDQRQRFDLEGFYPSNDKNMAYLKRKHGIRA